jgi:hypothetical protein
VHIPLPAKIAFGMAKTTPARSASWMNDKYTYCPAVRLKKGHLLSTKNNIFILLWVKLLILARFFS